MLIHQPEMILSEENAAPSASTSQQSQKPLQQDGNPPPTERLLPLDALEQVLQSLNPGVDHDVEVGLRKLLQLSQASENNNEIRDEIRDPASQRKAFSGDDLRPVIGDLKNQAGAQ